MLLLFLIQIFEAEVEWIFFHLHDYYPICRQYKRYFCVCDGDESRFNKLENHFFLSKEMLVIIILEKLFLSFLNKNFDNFYFYKKLFFKRDIKYENLVIFLLSL